MFSEVAAEAASGSLFPTGPRHLPSEEVHPMAPGFVSSCGDSQSCRSPATPPLLWPLDTRHVCGEDAFPVPRGCSRISGYHVSASSFQFWCLGISHAPSISSSPMHLLVFFFFPPFLFFKRFQKKMICVKAVKTEFIYNHRSFGQGFQKRPLASGIAWLHHRYMKLWSDWLG